MTDTPEIPDRNGQSSGITDLSAEATRDISAALKGLLADVFTLYLKTKNFHWHMSGPHFRDHHLLLDEQSDQIFAMTDPIAERATVLPAPITRRPK
jgi:starvation-inducible DNA-binding protein